ncbi:MAG: glutamate mutase L [Anaerolineales bacterium]|jgi:hypothetical protein
MSDISFEETQESLEQELMRIGSLLTVDIGAINTRAALYDAVEGKYRFLAAGVGQTTVNHPLFEVNEGVQLALDRLERISGRILAEESNLIIPSTKDGAGADYLAVTLSAGEPLKTVVVGLLERVSLASARNLANTIYSTVIESISLDDQRSPEGQIDTIQRLRPDVILIAGGTDDGASQSVLKLVNSIGLALYLLPESHRPEVLYAGNPKLADQVRTFIEHLAPIHIAPNIRPDLAKEQLGPAQTMITDIFRRIHVGRVPGMAALNAWSGGNLLPSSHGLGRVIRFFSQIVSNPESKGVLGVNVGASSTVVAGGFNGDLRLRVFTPLGMGEGLKTILEDSQMEDILRWLPIEVSPLYILDYIQTKITHPATLPATLQDLSIEQALAREVIRKSVAGAISGFPRDVYRLEANTLPVFDPIFAGGAVLANAPSLSQSLLMILDALEPTGIQRIILDKNNLASGLGAAAAIAPSLVSQLLLDPTAFLNLGFVISPISKAREGIPVLRIRIQYETGHENVLEVQHGELTTLPLSIGQRARIYLDPLHRTNIGFGPGKSSSLQVVGGPFGVVIDARGRPIRFSPDVEKRYKQIRRWQAAFT